jgi:hypothetical protein
MVGCFGHTLIMTYPLQFVHIKHTKYLTIPLPGKIHIFYDCL